MKRVFVLVAVALMSIVCVNAKTVRGYVSDKDGKPVAGLRLVAYNMESPGQPVMTTTCSDGYFELNVPDDLDVSDIRKIFCNRSFSVVNYRSTTKGLEIIVKPVPGTSR